MGCCLSTTTTRGDTAATRNKTDRNSHQTRHSPLGQSHTTRSPPPPPPPPQEDEDDEETVIKEVLVLSETPIPQKKQQDHETTQTLLAQVQPEIQTEVSTPTMKQLQQEEQETSEFSQFSEICSFSETISTATATTMTATTRKGMLEDEATSKEKIEVKQRSPVKVIKKHPGNGNGNGSGSGSGSVRAKRVDPSPEKRARGRGRGLGDQVRTTQRSVGSRSRSPGTGRSGGVGRGASVGKSLTGKTECKPIGDATVEGHSRKEEDEKGDVLEQQQQKEEGSETLENPLVSLECFIFL